MADEEIKSVDTNDEESSATEDREASQIDKVALFRRIKGWWRADAEHRSKWFDQADKDFAFIACDQWSDEDKKAMEANGRVPVVFNRVLTMIKSIAGSEINGRLETRFLPRGVEDTKVNELLSAASEWMADQCDAEDEQSEAFETALICGEGWTEARFSFDEDPEGKYEEPEIDPMEMYPDCKARKKNYADARRISRLRSISLTDAKAMFPKVEEEDLDASWAQFSKEGVLKTDPRPVEDKIHKDEMEDDVACDKTDVRILHMQWWEKEPFWLVALEPTPEQQMMMQQTGQQQKPEELDDEEYKEFSKRAKEVGIRFQAAKMFRRRYKQAFVGARVLEVSDAPCPYEFSFNAITGERDRRNGHFFGLVRLMRDPQMWANKMLANTLHIANTTAKGGIIAEKNAFDDERQAEESYAQPNVITWASEGAVKDARIMPKPGQGDPSVYIKLLEFAIASIRDVTGVNMELLGLRDANQPGILEAQRKQAAMTVLASLFNSLRRFRKAVGRVRLHIIQEHLSDGRLVRIKGEHGGRVEPLTRDRTLGDYDVIVSDAPTSPNQKEATWNMIQMALPVVKDFLTPDVMLYLLEYSPFPSDIVEKLREMKMQTEQQQAPIQQQQMQQQMQLMQAQIERLAAQSMKDKAAAQKTMSEAQVVGANVQAENMKGQAEAQKTMAEAHKTMAEAQGAQAQAEGARVQVENDRLQGRAEAIRTLHEADAARQQSEVDIASGKQQLAHQAGMNQLEMQNMMADFMQKMADLFDSKIQTALAVKKQKDDQDLARKALEGKTTAGREN